MITIGITGGSGAGKTTALRALKSMGALTLDCDGIYHELLSGSKPLKDELDDRFGVLRGGVIDRARLGEIVFSDPGALRDLNAITHKYVSAEVDSRLGAWKDSGGRIAVIDAILLLESGRGGRCDVVVGVTAPVGDRLKRIMLRDGVTKERAEARIAAQKPDSFYEENCDFLLKNVYNNEAEFERECVRFFTRIIGGIDSGGK